MHKRVHHGLEKADSETLDRDSVVDSDALEEAFAFWSPSRAGEVSEHSRGGLEHFFMENAESDELSGMTQVDALISKRHRSPRIAPPREDWMHNLQNRQGSVADPSCSNGECAKGTSHRSDDDKENADANAASYHSRQLLRLRQELKFHVEKKLEAEILLAQREEELAGLRCDLEVKNEKIDFLDKKNYDLKSKLRESQESLTQLETHLKKCKKQIKELTRRLVENESRSSYAEKLEDINQSLVSEIEELRRMLQDANSGSILYGARSPILDYEAKIARLTELVDRERDFFKLFLSKLQAGEFTSPENIIILFSEWEKENENAEFEIRRKKLSPTGAAHFFSNFCQKNQSNHKSMHYMDLHDPDTHTDSVDPDAMSTESDMCSVNDERVNKKTKLQTNKKSKCSESKMPIEASDKRPDPKTSVERGDQTSPSIESAAASRLVEQHNKMVETLSKQNMDMLYLNLELEKYKNRKWDIDKFLRANPHHAALSQFVDLIVKEAENNVEAVGQAVDDLIHHAVSTSIQLLCTDKFKDRKRSVNERQLMVNEDFLSNIVRISNLLHLTLNDHESVHRLFLNITQLAQAKCDYDGMINKIYNELNIVKEKKIEIETDLKQLAIERARNEQLLIEIQKKTQELSLVQKQISFNMNEVEKQKNHLDVQLSELQKQKREIDSVRHELIRKMKLADGINTQKNAVFNSKTAFSPLATSLPNFLYDESNSLYGTIKNYHSFPSENSNFYSAKFLSHPERKNDTKLSSSMGYSKHAQWVNLGEIDDIATRTEELASRNNTTTYRGAYGEPRKQESNMRKRYEQVVRLLKEADNLKLRSSSGSICSTAATRPPGP